MKGKTIIVTGGSSGMGKAIAALFCQEGANVVISGRNEERLQAAKQEMETFAGQVLTVAMDVREPDQVEDMVRQAKEKFGRIDYLVNNAAGNFIVPAEELSLNGWHAVINIVLNGTWYCTQAVAKDWIANKQKGSILNIVATYAWTGAAGVVHSASAKAGVLAMTQTLAVEWGSKYGIRVNAIAPGAIENTGGAEKLIANEKVANFLKNQIPLKRFGRPEEIAGLARFLLSDEAEYINGECVTMDGGFWLAHSRFL
ncbi:2,4-dienoyl-CoA reductase [Thermoflavimicrobium dichotomicum]|uniref:NAD(P)-dependent dehydrogenase, short-chain alcohol dehydrogenase family n=1 Tax=Thermoflavimicrobium dichotomicum TaxID=46223 RepID=A0A1I3QG47_9BACL|nr:2,4-dienoyl-CoA reductase [Thermoflavimicrobium dichotomicum]SFJ32301.1 NAD(P)-dependent dehydrogenase, short-chain alcohol dehydrogenase family [Thermoflavimicrobium dichotomicum]